MHGTYHLGAIYHFGLGAPEDQKESVYWFRQAAEKDGYDSLVKLGKMYDDGKIGEYEYTLQFFLNYQIAIE